MSAPHGTTPPHPTAPSTAGAPTAVAPASPGAPGVGLLPDRVAGALLAHPEVVGLSGGPFGAITTYLPGRRVAGVRLATGDEPAEVGVVLRLGAPVRPTAASLRELVAELTGSRRVDVVVVDVEEPGARADGPGAPATAGQPPP